MAKSNKNINTKYMNNRIEDIPHPARIASRFAFISKYTLAIKAITCPSS